MVADRRGFALVIVLVATAAIFALAVQGALSLRAATIETGALRETARLERAARDASLLVLVGLCAGPDEAAQPGGAGSSSADSDHGGADEPVEAPDIPELPPEIKSLIGDLIGEQQKPDPGESSSGNVRTDRSSRRNETGAFSRFASRGLPRGPVDVTLDGVAVRVTLADGQGLVNVNTAPEEQLIRYFGLCGVTEGVAIELAHQIIDWRDPDDFVHPRGAERSEHLRRGVSPRNGPILAMEELLFLPSMTPRLFDDVRAGLTLESDGRVSALSAPFAALASVPGLTDTLAMKIVQLRESGALSRDTLKQVLTGFAIEAENHLRLEPTASIRLRVEVAGGAVFEGEAFISNRAGPRILSMLPAPRPLSPGVVRGGQP